MHRILPAPLLGLLALSLVVLNTFAVGGVLLPVAAVKFAIPADGWRRAWTRVLLLIAECWTRLNAVILALTLPTRWEFSGLDNPALSTRGRYIVTSNHQTWCDVLLLQRILTGYIPFLRFFIKQQLFWMPILGQAWWA
ncbi:MAG: 1-acyl-sn-glycerol-3-phosphate acyltransferase, partial [Deltaproteobacteria bacterium]|nr:1-acyl-sn-glycerol-3-phosphate acyltransferase [Deltaproteobacteria bacterium]